MQTPSNIRRIDSDGSDAAAIAEAAGCVADGGIIVFPTRCLYGLGADALNPEAVGRVFALKNRPADNPLLVLVRDISEIDRFAKEIPPAARSIMVRFWPGSITLVFKAGPGLPGALTAGTGKIGIRIPGHPVAAALVKALGGPITGTSANLAGDPGADRIETLDPRMAAAVDLILDAGPLAGGAGSTIVDVTVDPPRVLREGVLPTAKLFGTGGY